MAADPLGLDEGAVGGELDGVLHGLLGFLQCDHGAPQLHRAAVPEHRYNHIDMSAVFGEVQRFLK